jgi:hypothetical protein
VLSLPPSLETSKDQPELAARYRAIGESTRMSLLFRKPGAEAGTSAQRVAPGGGKAPPVAQGSVAVAEVVCRGADSAPRVANSGIKT